MPEEVRLWRHQHVDLGITHHRHLILAQAAGTEPRCAPSSGRPTATLVFLLAITGALHLAAQPGH